MRRSRALLASIFTVIGGSLFIALAAPAAERRAYDRCLEILPPFPFRSDRITVDWRVGLPPYECVYWFKGRVFLRQ